MGTLRDRLKQNSPELYHALLRSWDIAWDEWLPALGVQMDSYNSFPHIRNLENYLDRIVEDVESTAGDQVAPLLNPTESYIILSSVLFHDIGRISGSSDAHGKNSRDLIEDHRAELGIPSVEIAHSLAKICHYHNVAESARAELESTLSDIVVDGYGIVRERSLASLLTLVDYLDSAFTRVLPIYLRSDEQIEPVGAFRRIIKGVRAEHEAQMVRTVLGDPEEEKPTTPGSERAPIVSYEHTLNWKRYGDAVFGKAVGDLLEERKFGRLEIRPGDTLSIIDTETKKPADEALLKEFSSAISAKLISATSGEEDCDLITAMNGHWDKQDPAVRNLTLERTAAKQQVHIKKECGTWPAQMLASIVMGNVRENAEALVRERDCLAAMGIPLRAWLVDYREHLYNWRGEETHEPIFHTDYLRAVADGMWRLSTQIFGSSTFTYENLASTIREPNLSRVKTAVRRIGIVTSNERPEGIGRDEWRKGAIWVGDSCWEWNVDQKAHGRCHYVSSKQVSRKLEKLGKST